MKILLFFFIILFCACQKVDEKFNFACDVMQIKQYYNAKCPDTVFIQIYKKGITEDQQLYWLATFPDEQKIWMDGDTVLITNVIIGCGKTICP
jgi:hypothetical protein